MYHRNRLTLNETAVFGPANRWHVRKVRDIGLRSGFSIQLMIARWSWDSEGSLGYRRRQGRWRWSRPFGVTGSYRLGRSSRVALRVVSARQLSSAG
jgi:hypothetical protein